MTHEQVRARVQEVVKELELAARQAQAIQTKYGAHFQLHTAACLDKDEQLQFEHRQSLHVLLDELLDNGERIQKLNDEMQQLAKQL
jgi:hypothetical protein